VATERLERLLNLVAALLDTDRPLTADVLGTRVPGYPEPGGATFKRAFERDKASLRAMGIPLEVVELEPSNPESAIGYRVRRDRYDLLDPGLEPDELAALHFAATQVQLEGGDATAAIWKLGGVPTAADAPPDGRAAALPSSTYLPMLFAAVSERRPVMFTYRGEERTVEPWRIEFRNGTWYLIGLDTGRQSRRTFRLDRLETEPVTGPAAAFEAPAETEGMATHPWEMGDEEPVEVRVLVDPDHARWALADSKSPAQTRPDGAVVLSLRVTNRSGLRSWVLNFLDGAEILDPPDERAAMVAWLEASRPEGPGADTQAGTA
jgi:predicted DNA-binding transcriptional regulator YafY